ncbi:MAG TPA: FimV/HubP family polar landmark protein [Ottowia sp.]|uniref:FimV/HubP family polar landmark protein n=1 Tax=Ottowia sp. TaxID=1898956 RepID=UPI002CD70558|nr:FimV/HubP family polar landmark protein [Ottowia sp.]HMN20561.1 FimV/HubP family polar landmark protein [Ottowia sp.]
MGTHLSAQALALGAVTVRSALGEPLRAEIVIPQISSEEASSLQATVGSPESFRAAGVDYNAALAGARVTLHWRADGQAYLRVVGDRPVNEPFLGLVIEASWATGKIVRDYTMLIDPPQHAPAAAVVATPAQAAAPQAQPATAEQITPAPASRPAARRRAASMPAPVTAPAPGGDQVTVQRGDTASGLLRRHAVAGASLDQMLIALLQANPQAFIRGNINLVKAGAVVQLPTAEQAQAVSRADARRLVLAQSRDFQTYRSGLARAAPAAEASTAAAGRSATGSVQAEVKETQAAPAPADRLTVSKAGGGAAGTESEAALSRQAQEQADRVAELSKNLSELERLQSSAASSPAAATTGSVPTGSGLEVPVAGSTPAAETAPTPPAEASAAADAAASSTPTSAADDTSASSAAPTTDPAAATTDSASTTDVQPASDGAAAPTDGAPASESAVAEPAAPAEEEKPAPAPAQAAPAPAPAPAATPSFLDDLMENPLLPVGGAALIALLAGLGFYRSRQRKKQEASMDSEFIESRMQPDSFFGASGGQRVNTQEGISRTGASSMSYSPSQLDAAGDVDPVAEADVYLAYGRDMQAEEILKEALLVHPRRLSLHRKLAEIYAKRRDMRALDAIATEAYEVTQGEGPEWQAIASLGAELDANNPMYQPGGKPRPKTGPAPEGRQFGADTEPQTATVVLSKEPESTGRAPLDLDLAGTAETGEAPLPPLPDTSSADTASTVPLAAATAAGMSAASAALSNDPVDLDLGMDFTPPTQSPAPASAPAALGDIEVGDSGMIDFDMSALAVDPDSRSGSDIHTEQPEDADDDPLSTKLSLAQEFRSIGDVEGARSLAQEVVAEASGALKIKAERFLAEL